MFIKFKFIEIVLCFCDTLCTFPILCVMPVTVIAKSVPIILIYLHSDIDGRHNLPCSENSHSFPFWILNSWKSFCTVYISPWEFEPTRCSENSRLLIFHFAFCTVLTFCTVWISPWGFEPTRWQTKCLSIKLEIQGKCFAILFARSFVMCA